GGQLAREARQDDIAIAVGHGGQLIERGDLRGELGRGVELTQERAVRGTVVEPAPREIRPRGARSTLQLGEHLLLADRLGPRARLGLRLALLGASRIEIEWAERRQMRTDIAHRAELVATRTQLVDQPRAVAYQPRPVPRPDPEVARQLGLVDRVRTPHRVHRGRDVALACLVASGQLILGPDLVEVGVEQPRDVGALGAPVAYEPRADPA